MENVGLVHRGLKRIHPHQCFILAAYIFSKFWCTKGLLFLDRKSRRISRSNNGPLLSNGKSLIHKSSSFRGIKFILICRFPVLIRLNEPHIYSYVFRFLLFRKVIEKYEPRRIDEYIPKAQFTLLTGTAKTGIISSQRKFEEI